MADLVFVLQTFFKFFLNFIFSWTKEWNVQIQSSENKKDTYQHHQKWNKVIDFLPYGGTYNISRHSNK